VSGSVAEGLASNISSHDEYLEMSVKSMEESRYIERKHSLIDMIQHLITQSNLRPAYIKLPIAVLEVHKSEETCTGCFVLQF
jgi:TPP-dependent 2-oxoacid decarboxylase